MEKNVGRGRCDGPRTKLGNEGPHFTPYVPLDLVKIHL